MFKLKKCKHFYSYTQRVIREDCVDLWCKCIYCGKEKFYGFNPYRKDNKKV